MLLLGGQNCFLAALTILHLDDLKNIVQISLFFNSSWCKIASVGLRGNELKKFHPPRSRDDFCLLFCINPSSMIGMDCVRRFGSIELRDKQNRGKKIICFTPKELKILSVDSRAGFYYSISTVSDFPESQSPRRIIYFEKSMIHGY